MFYLKSMLCDFCSNKWFSSVLLRYACNTALKNVADVYPDECMAKKKKNPITEV